MNKETENELHILVCEIQQLVESLSDKTDHAHACRIIKELNNWASTRYRVSEIEYERDWNLKQARDEVERAQKRIEDGFNYITSRRNFKEEAERRRLERQKDK
jgi:hypothetical protein